jgi:hypothetical protein
VLAITAFVTLAFQGFPPQVGRPYIELGVCEGECCTLGPFRATDRIPVFSNPGTPTTIVGWLAPGDTVRPSEGNLHWKQVGGVLVLRSLNYEVMDDTTVGQLQAGDTIPVLSYSGEGYVNIWHKGEKRLVMSFWDDGRQRPAANPEGRLVVRGKSLWWLRIRTRSAVQGWIIWSRRLENLDQSCS